MITIYGKPNRDLVGELMGVSRQALDALQQTIERLETSGRPTVVERARLEALQTVLARLEEGMEGPPAWLD